MQTQAPSAITAGPPVPVPRYEEEEEDSEEDVYAPELPPDLAAARANANATTTTSSSSSSSSVPAATAAAARRPIGPAARGPLQREEEEEGSEDEIGPAPPPGVGPSSHVHEDAVIDFMQKEAQRRQAVEVRVSSSASSGFLVLVVPPVRGALTLVQCVHVRHSVTYLPVPLSPLQEAARPKTLKRDEWMLVPPSSSDLLSSALLFPSLASSFSIYFLSPNNDI